MQIRCPKCGAQYQIDDNLAQNQKRRLKCSSCASVFTIAEGVIAAQVSTSLGETDDSLQTSADSDITPDSAAEDTVSAPAPDSEPETEEEVNLEKIFERLSEHTERLITAEKKLPFYEKFWLQVKNVLGFHFKIKWLYIFAFAGIVAVLSLYNNRYQIVRDVPFMNNVYKLFGIKAKIPGEGLEFQNVTWEFIKDDNGPRLDIRGFINNLTDHDVDVPVIHVEILDHDISLLQSLNRELETSAIAPHSKLSLNLTVQNPAPVAKYIYLTFIDKN